MNGGQAYSLSAHPPTRGTRTHPLRVGNVPDGKVFSLISSLPSSLSADEPSVFVRMIHRCRVGGGASGFPDAGHRPPLKPCMQFSRTRLSRRLTLPGCN